MRLLAFMVAALATLAAARVLVADADEKSAEKPAASATLPARQARPKNNKNKQPLAITAEREAAVMNFVERNHAELGELLDYLKTSQPRQYEQAIKDIYRVTERLATIQERDPLHYELEVKLWTAQSRVQLLAARLKMSDSESVKKDLREALAAQVDARLDVLKHQKKQAAQRLEKMDKDIEQLEANKDKTIERQLESLARSADSTGRAGGKVAKKRIEKKENPKKAAE
jgi:hypothetical protein